MRNPGLFYNFINLIISLKSVVSIAKACIKPPRRHERQGTYYDAKKTLGVFKQPWRSFPEDTGTMRELGGSKNNSSRETISSLRSAM